MLTIYAITTLATTTNGNKKQKAEDREKFSQF